jgi:hypothetical protein
MSVQSRRVRFAWLFAAIFQLVLPAVAAVVDGRAEADAVRYASRTHIEADGATGCPRVHPENCVVCRVLATLATTNSHANVAAPVARSINATIADIDRPARPTRFPSDPPQRAPPV